MGLCRECDAFLWRAPETCPSCSARRPCLLVRTVAPARRRPATSAALTAGAVLGGPGLLVLDDLLRRLLSP